MEEPNESVDDVTPEALLGQTEVSGISPALDDDHDPFEDLASEFSEKLRKGEHPSIEEYAQAHPDIADEIRDLFPTIAAMEHTKQSRQEPRPNRVQESLPIEQLGDFRLLGEIGRGGMGIVYEAEQVSLGRRVAVKVLPKQLLLDERHVRRFEREAQTAAKLHHTNIVPVFGVGQQDGYNYIVMQFIRGVGLDEVLLALRHQLFNDDMPGFDQESGSRATHATHNAKALLNGKFGELVANAPSSSFVRQPKTSGGPTKTIVRPRTTTGISQTMQIDGLSTDDNESVALNEPQTDSNEEAKELCRLGSEFYRSVAKIGEQVADALAYAHEQETLHRDIKPGNLLLDSSGTVWVADFGLAKLIEQDNVSRTGDVVGTLSYIPPESFSGETDSRGDIYSLGLSLFELLTLRPVFQGRDRGKLVRDITEGNLPKLSKLNPGIPRDLETIVLKAVSHRPEDRYATSREMANDLDCFLNDMPITARRMSIPEQFTRWCRKNKLVASLSAAVLTLLIALSGVLGVSNYTISNQRDDLEDQRDSLAEQRDEIENQNIEIQQERDYAQATTRDAMAFIFSMFDRFDPFILPLTAGDSVAVLDESPNTVVAPDDRPAGTTIGETGAVTIVAPPPVKAETAALLESLLGDLDGLVQRADKDTDFAQVFAEFRLRIAKIHKTLGKNERAIELFDDAIARYEALLAIDETIEAATGLAVCLNEKGDLLDHRDGQALFERARKTLDSREDLNPRATYELARTLFFMSIQQVRPSTTDPKSGPIRDWRSYLDIKLKYRKAIGLLEPLVKTESNPEYRYLLARCCIGLSLLPPHHEQAEHISRAIAELGKLETAKVPDYQFEYAVAKLRLAETTFNAEVRERELNESVGILDSICSANPSVANYHVMRSRALQAYAEHLDRSAMKIETIQETLTGIKTDGSTMSRERAIAGEVVTRAYRAYFSASDAFGEKYTKRLPAEHLVVLAQIITKSYDDGMAIELFREALDLELPLDVEVRAKLGLAKLLKEAATSPFEFLDAQSMIAGLAQDLPKFINQEFEDQSDDRRGRRRRPRSRRLPAIDLFLTLCRAEFELSDFERMQHTINKFADKRVENSNFSQATKAEFYLELSHLYLELGEIDRGSQLQEQSLDELESICNSKSFGRDFRDVGHAVRVLEDYYRKESNEQAWTSLLEKLPPPPSKPTFSPRN